MVNWEHKKGETPYDNDLSGFLCFDKFPSPTRQQVDSLEAENIRITYVKYLAGKPSKKIAPFTYEWLLKLHKEMYGNVWAWAGDLRTTERNIGVPANQVGECLRILTANITAWPNYFKDPIEIAARFHHEAVRIHPFNNGNGRWSRLLSDIWLKQNGYPVTKWPDIVGEGSVRDEYLYAVKQADDLNFEPLLEMYRKYQMV